jgi:hypothetical protein
MDHDQIRVETRHKIPALPNLLTEILFELGTVASFDAPVAALDNFLNQRIATRISSADSSL